MTQDVPFNDPIRDADRPLAFFLVLAAWAFGAFFISLEFRPPEMLPEERAYSGIWAADCASAQRLSFGDRAAAASPADKRNRLTFDRLRIVKEAPRILAAETELKNTYVVFTELAHDTLRFDGYRENIKCYWRPIPASTEKAYSPALAGLLTPNVILRRCSPAPERPGGSAHDRASIERCWRTYTVEPKFRLVLVQWCSVGSAVARAGLVWRLRANK